MAPGSALALQQQDEATYRDTCKGAGAMDIPNTSGHHAAAHQFSH